MEGSALSESQRCTAHSSRTGEPCKKYAVRGTTVCRSHGAAAGQVQRKAAERIAEARDSALDKLTRLIEAGEVDAKVALDAVVKLTETHETLEGRVARREGMVVDERSQLDAEIAQLLTEG